MPKKSYAMHVSMIVGSSVVLLVFIFVLVGHHHDIPDRVRLDRGALLGTGSSVAERSKPAAQVGVPAAEARREPVKKAPAAPTSGR